MRCIENHPQRNSLVTGTATVSGSTRTLQLKIESLKRELALRDTMCGYAMYTNPSAPSPRPDVSPLDRQPILDTLTKQQLVACQRMTCRFALSGAEKDLDVRSLAEVRAVVGMLRSALWSACGGEQSSVLQTLKEAAGRGGGWEVDLDQETIARPGADRSSRMADVDEEEEEQTAEEGTGDEVGDRDEAEDGTQEQAKYVEQREAAPVVAPNPQRFAPSQPPPPLADERDADGEEGRGDESAADPFTLFKQSEGHALHETYEELKLQLKDAKNRQKALVKQVNQTKVEIDTLTSQATGPDSPAASSNDFSPQKPVEDSSRSSLIELKGVYKQTRGDLIACKEQIVDLNRKKQQALNALVSAYEAFVSVSPTGGEGVDRAVLEGLVAEDVLSKRQQHRVG
jgi:hypothetical protein